MEIYQQNIFGGEDLVKPTMSLQDFIERKQQELEQSGKYRKVQVRQPAILAREAVMLSKNSVAERFVCNATPLEQIGQEVDLSTLPEMPSVPYVENGTKLVFEVIEKRKRKPTYIAFYFLWV